MDSFLFLSSFIAKIGVCDKTRSIISTIVNILAPINNPIEPPISPETIIKLDNCKIIKLPALVVSNPLEKSIAQGVEVNKQIKKH